MSSHQEVSRGRVARRVVFLMAVSLALVACGPGESSQARQERWDSAKKECSEMAAKAAIPPGSSSFGRANEAVAVKTLKECMSSRGFEVDLK